MYTTPVTGSLFVAGGTLAATGVNIVWIVLGGFALISAGLALMRLIRRREA
jgi:LPXTG-motif cell wall-anchored protein